MNPLIVLILMAVTFMVAIATWNYYKPLACGAIFLWILFGIFSLISDNKLTLEQWVWLLPALLFLASLASGFFALVFHERPSRYDPEANKIDFSWMEWDLTPTTHYRGRVIEESDAPQLEPPVHWKFSSLRDEYNHYMKYRASIGLKGRNPTYEEYLQGRDEWMSGK